MKRIKKMLTSLPIEAVYDTMKSSVGLLWIVASDLGIHCILWDHEADTDACRSVLKDHQHHSNHKMIIETKKQLKEYFSGKRKTFDIELSIEGTPFQKQVWQELSKIPYGQTISYGEQAQRLGNKNKARAVGLANGRNPVSIIVPCHRVIGSDGHLTGFGGGLECKKYLIDLERNKP